MAAPLSSHSDPSRISDHNVNPSRRGSATLSPFRELRRHLAAIHRILNHNCAGRGNINASIATRLGESLCALARAARAVGLTTYCSITLHVLEQFSSISRTRYVPRDAHELMLRWVSLSWLYLFAPANSVHAVELVAHMGNLRWERPVCRIQRDLLLESLRMETLLLSLLRQGVRSSTRRR